MTSWYKRVVIGNNYMTAYIEKQVLLFTLDLWLSWLPNINPKAQTFHPKANCGRGPLFERPLNILRLWSRLRNRIGPAKSTASRCTKSTSSKWFGSTGPFDRWNRNRTLFRCRRWRCGRQVASRITSLDFSEDFFETFRRPTIMKETTNTEKSLAVQP